MAKKKKKDKKDGAEVDPRGQSLSPEDMAALLDEAIGDDDDLEIETDETPDDATSQAAIAAILSSATMPQILTGPADSTPPEALESVDEDPPDIETPDPASADEAAPKEQRWDPIQDLEVPDLELIATEEPITDDVRWAAVQDQGAEDVPIQDSDELLADPWGPLGVIAANQSTEGMVVAASSPPLELPPPVAVLLGSDEPDPGPAARAAAPALDPLPWRGTAVVVTPELPDQLYVADVTQQTSQLLVAAWELDEDEPGGRVVRVRLADDSDAIELETTAPHEPLVVLAVQIGRKSLTVRAALTVERGRRGLRLGRDVLAGRFTVDPSTSNWPKPTED